MTRKTILCILLGAASAMLLHAQPATLKPLSHSDYDNWKNLVRPLISPSGGWISYEVNPQKGDGWLHLVNPSSGRHDSVARGQNAVFSYTSDMLVFTVKQPEDSVRKLKLAKKKKEDMPKDSLGIWILQKDSISVFPGLKSFQPPAEGGAWLAYLHEKQKEEKAKKAVTDTLSKTIPDSLKPETKEEFKKDKKKKKGAWADVETWNLTVMAPLENFRNSFENATEFTFSKNGSLVAFVTLHKDSIDTVAVQVFDTRTRQVQKIFEKPGFVKKITADGEGRQLAFLFTADTGKVKRYSLFLWKEKDSFPRLAADTASAGMLPGWEVSENGNISFSENGQHLYFGTAPKIRPQPKDTLTDDEKVKVDLWHYLDPRLQSQQLKELDEDLKKSYTAVYHIPKSKLVQLADTAMPMIKTYKKGDADFALGVSDLPYRILTSWEEAEYKDVWLVDVRNGDRKLLLEKKPEFAGLSPEGKYLLWYETADSAWYSMEISNGKTRNLTGSLQVPFHNEQHDTPSLPGPYGVAGWTQQDGSVLVYDRYDIWQLYPGGDREAVNLTGNGRETKTSFRYVKLDPDALSIDPSEPLLLKSVAEESCREGFAELSVSRPGRLTILMSADKELSSPVKAKKSVNLIFQQSSYTEYPDLWTCNRTFESPVRISNTNPQQANFIWGSVEAVSWTSLDGKPLKGLLYKPGNFDPALKYPMIVYFYERYSDKLHDHYVPSPSRSTVSFPVYNSNGYLVFVPDIAYSRGHPGDDAYKAIMSGTLEMMKRPCVDADHMGLQGQSWGGYQTAYMVTRTGLFRAAMAGAAVSNMTSAYGGIRWESGRVRQFQYEQSQSRIGGTLWTDRDLFIENSPVFFADRITTPLLMMNNDNDGAVPWYQGIELFTALRRLGKPAWMLNYNGDEHNLTRRANRMDLSIRMMQFFDHYLKGSPMPAWMKEGIPATQKGKTLGYETD